MSSDNEERDGGLWLKAYTDDNEKYSITIYGYKNIDVYKRQVCRILEEEQENGGEE